MDVRKRIHLILSSDLNKKIFNHSFWILLGNTLSKGFLLIATILMSQYLSKTEYGEFGIIKSTILMFAMFSGLELGMTATKYISQYRFSDQLKVERIVGISNVFAITISVIVASIVYSYSTEIAAQINAPHLNIEIKISSFILFFSSLNGIQNGILAGLEKFKILSVNNTVAGVISSIALVFTSKYLGLGAVVIAFGSNFFLLFILNYISLRRYFYNEFKINIFSAKNFQEASVLWKFSLPAILAGIMVGPVTWYCNYLLVNHSNGFEEMAMFDIASQWRNTILFIPAALSQIALPMLAASVDNTLRYKTVFNKNLKSNIYIGLVLVIFFICISPLIISFYGEKYNGTLIPMILMFITTGFIAVNNVIGQALASKNQMWLGFYFNVLWAIVLVALCFYTVTILEFGATGMALSFLMSYIVHTTVQFAYIKKVKF